MYIVTLNSLETYSSFASGKGFLTVTMTQADTLHNQILLMCHTLKLPSTEQVFYLQIRKHFRVI